MSNYRWGNPAYVVEIATRILPVQTDHEMMRVVAIDQDGFNRHAGASSLTIPGNRL